VSTTEATTTSSPAPDANRLLVAALESYRDGYEFVATTAVNDQEAVVQTGRWFADASQLTVGSSEAEVEYIVTASGQWARLPDGEWEQIDGAPDVAFPLGPMATPQSIELIAGHGDTATAAAVYPAAAMGLSGDPIEVVLDFRRGVLVGMSFTTDIEGNAVESTTSLSPLSDTTPITAPTS
jgi:hypothetical protein